MSTLVLYCWCTSSFVFSVHENDAWICRIPCLWLLLLEWVQLLLSNKMILMLHINENYLNSPFIDTCTNIYMYVPLCGKSVHDVTIRLSLCHNFWQRLKKTTEHNLMFIGWFDVAFRNISANLWRNSCLVSKFRPAARHPLNGQLGFLRCQVYPTWVLGCPKTSLTVQKSNFKAVILPQP